jgi:iron complex outermembrane receptor protein
MKTLEALPGVSSIEIGSGHSKPVIRGLGFNRILVLENGIRHEGQQWGSDHGLEIDQFAANTVEVIKGPASLLYGSDAIGGVLDIKHNRIPAKNSLTGTADFIAKSNNGLLGTSLYAAGRKGKFYLGLRATILDYGDYTVPTDSIDIYSYRVPLYKNRLRNTAGNERGIHMNFGYFGEKLQSKFFLSKLNSNSGFFANAHGLEPRSVDAEFHDRSSRDIQYPRHQVGHIKLVNNSTLFSGQYRIDASLGFQRNERSEWSDYVDHGFMPSSFPDTLEFPHDLERHFDKFIYSGNLKIAYNYSKRTVFLSGFNADYQHNAIDGRQFIIPAFRQFNGGLYITGKHSINTRNILNAGIRYDYGRIRTQSYFDWFMTPFGTGEIESWEYVQRAEEIDRKFSNSSWSVGYNYNGEFLSFRTNIGKSFRMPIAKELAANGVNYHHFSFEKGDPGLSPEISYQLDAGFDYRIGKMIFGASPFINYFSNYIYLNPGFEHDRLYGNGNQIFQYQQSKVFRAGAELFFQYMISKSIQASMVADHVYSEQLSGDKKGFTLPFSPPPSVVFGLEYKRDKVGQLEDAYARVNYRISASQKNIVPPEEITKGFQVLNLSLGVTMKISKQDVMISMQAQNLLNSRYFNHTSYYRLINVPEPGRNFIINISIPVNIESKNY